MTSTDVKVRLLFHTITLFRVNYCIFYRRQTYFSVVTREFAGSYARIRR